MIANVARAAMLAALIWTDQPPPALADACGNRISALQTNAKGLALKQRSLVTNDFDAFYLESRNPPAGITVSCGPKVLSFDAEWSGGSLSTYSNLLKQVSQSLDLVSEDFLSSLKTCWGQAEINDDEDGEGGTVVTPTSRGQISCVRKDGKTEITVTGPQP